MTGERKGRRERASGQGSRGSAGNHIWGANSRFRTGLRGFSGVLRGFAGNDIRGANPPGREKKARRLPDMVHQGDHLGPKIPNNLKNNGPYENCSHFWDIF